MTATEALRTLWRETGGEPAALDAVDLPGNDPVLPSSFAIGAAAQASIAACGLAAAEFLRMRGGRRQRVAVDMAHAALAFQSERHLTVDGQGPPAIWDSIAGVYQASDGRYLRLHTNFPHHRAAITRLLDGAGDRDAVQAALSRWTAPDFEAAATAEGGVVAMMRSHAEWDRHPQAAALARLPVVEITRIGDADARPLPAIGDQPLSGQRVLDLSRIIAAPVAGRSLAAHGAEVLHISAAHLPSIDWLAIDTGRGKRSAQLDLRDPEARATLEALVRGADIFSQGYRPHALAKLGFGPESLARLRPGIVAVSLSAYGRLGPWAERRGFDSLVQTATGFNAAEAAAAGQHRPKEFPAQALDHATGYLMACGAMIARARQAREGGSWHVEVSLARTGLWLRSLGRIENGFSATPPPLDPSMLETVSSPFGLLRAIRHPARLSETPALSASAASPGQHAAAWV